MVGIDEISRFLAAYCDSKLNSLSSNIISQLNENLKWDESYRELFSNKLFSRERLCDSL
jgi:hypothetical protein